MSVETFTGATVHADGFDIAYREAGSGAPLVFLHGAGGAAIAAAHEALAADFRVILFEIPGFGESPANTRSATAAQLADTMHEAARRVTGGPYTLAGTSFGSRIASWAAVRHADEIERLVLLAPTGVLPDGFTPPTGEQMLGGPERLYAHPENARPRAPLSLGTAAKQAELVGRLLTPRDEELEAAYRTLDVPTLLLFGTHDPRIPASLARRYLELNPDFAVLFVYDAGHVLEEERPEATADAIGDFARRGAGFVVNRNDNRIFP
ncbi:alpha/beta fold hydrolase [Amycolatopsis pithecellobii]|uniref:Alpha/beta fold hydrolase n=1 Tax=Amycolatopsis pithecellobii TaxID=664692 RepID=A0A6N7Z0S7_9PSEU|nr:alpha/beta hydrolase [Amycolatopsis pithecellobii]MTD53210.1 alpha/beta fold hydrolase [Amycolatopsis pithecellobii]